ncbi:MAG: hypothetical protein M3Y41_17615, partial [Pseudomonadota bacterium]|nr:hypothetical protein [Pseudomonadota bacterium]
MILYQADNPMDGSTYEFTRRQIKLTAVQSRRSGLQAIHRAHGSVDGYGGQPNPLNPTQLTYQFRWFPREDRTTYDALRQQLAAAVGHGMPQNLRFRDDSGNIWIAVGKLTQFPADVTVASPLWQDVQLQWELPTPFLRLARQSGGPLVWGDVNNADGTPVRWGQAAPDPGVVWGQAGAVYALNTAIQDLPVINNPLGTQYTTDPILTLSVPVTSYFGPASPGPIGGPGANITITNQDVSQAGDVVQFAIYGTCLFPGDTLTINLAT